MQEILQTVAEHVQISLNCLFAHHVIEAKLLSEYQGVVVCKGKASRRIKRSSDLYRQKPLPE